jgi:hypothetical protein
MSVRKIGILAALAAAAVMSAAGDAGAAKTKTTYIELDGYCDVFTLTVFAWHQAGEYDNSCDGVNAVGSGMEGKVVGVSPKDLTIGETYFGDPNSTYLFNFQYPLQTGGWWSRFQSSDGVNFTVQDSGTYTIVGPEAIRLPRTGQPVHLAVKK